MTASNKSNSPPRRQGLTAKELFKILAALLGTAAVCVGVAGIVLIPAMLLGRWIAQLYNLGWVATSSWIVALCWQAIAWMTTTEKTTLKYFDRKTGTLQPDTPTRPRDPRRRLILIVTALLVVLGAVAEKYLP